MPSKRDMKEAVSAPRDRENSDFSARDRENSGFSASSEGSVAMRENRRHLSPNTVEQPRKWTNAALAVSAAIKKMRCC